MAILLNVDLSRGFTIPQVAEKHGCTEPMVWSIALEEKDDLVRFKELGWGLRQKKGILWYKFFTQRKVQVLKKANIV